MRAIGFTGSVWTERLSGAGVLGAPAASVRAASACHGTARSCAARPSTPRSWSGCSARSPGSVTAGGKAGTGAASLIARANGVADSRAIRDKLTEMVHLNETMYACALAAAVEARPTDAG